MCQSLLKIMNPTKLQLGGASRNAIKHRFVRLCAAFMEGDCCMSLRPASW